MRGDDTVNERLGRIGMRGSDRRPGETIKPDARRDSKSPQRELPSLSIELPDMRATLRGAAERVVTRDLEVVRTLGEGGMARVLLAKQHSLGRQVAVKTVRDISTDVEREALIAEGAITGSLEHPSVIPVHALGIDHEGRPALVMKWVEGATWSERLNAGDVELDAQIEILIQVSNAADFAHGRGIVHRDIKPENVMLGRYGEVYLADWGLALRLDRAIPVTPLSGTPTYMAPEMVVGGVIDARTDVYLLGATLHRILVGKPRHIASDVRAALLQAMESTPYEYPSSVPAPLAELANQATASNPDQRPQTAADFKLRLSEYLRHKGSIALARSAWERIEKLRTWKSDASTREFEVLAAEARFAVQEAKRAWADNPEAQRASSVLEQLLEARSIRAAELERLARELDPNLTPLPRAVMALASGAVCIGLAAAAFTDQHAVDTRAIFYESLAPTVVVGLILLLLRGRVVAQVNRRALVGLFIVVVTVTVHRALSIVAGSPASNVLVGDALYGASIAAFAAIAALRWLVYPAAVMTVAALWAAAVPPDAMRAFSAGSAVCFLLCIIFAARPQQKRA